jgi:hypothetical protein
VHPPSVSSAPSRYVNRLKHALYVSNKHHVLGLSTSLLSSLLLEFMLALMINHSSFGRTILVL